MSVGARRRILAISSGGGHWVELLRLRPAFEGHFAMFATVRPSYRVHVPDAPMHVVRDVTRWDRLGLVRGAAEVAALLVRERPDVVMSTGALPGFMAVVLAKRMGARTAWVDSLANVDELSMSGRRIGPHADLWLTQWPQLARPEGPRCEGSVLSFAPANTADGAPGAPRAQADERASRSGTAGASRSDVPPALARWLQPAARDEAPVRRVFVTVGAQMPFDRLIVAVDRWAATQRGVRVLAQVGDSHVAAPHLEAVPFLEPPEFDLAYEEADVVIGHAGVGTLFAALERGAPLVVMPREAARRETRNDHQTATARRFESEAGVCVAWDEHQLGPRLDALHAAPPSSRLGPHASDALLEAVARFVDGR